MEIALAGLVTQPERAHTTKIAKHAKGVVQKFGGRTSHATTEHPHGVHVGDVRTRVRRAVEKGSDEALIALEKRVADGRGILNKVIGHQLREVFGMRQMRLSRPVS